MLSTGTQSVNTKSNFLSSENQNARKSIKVSRGYFIYAKLRIRPMSVRCILVPRARLSWSRALLLQLRVTLGTRTRPVQFLHLV